MKKALRNSLIALFTCSSTAFAAEAAASTDGGLLIALFVGFFSLIIVFQLVPAVMMLIGMLKGVFSSKVQLDH